MCQEPKSRNNPGPRASTYESEVQSAGAHSAGSITHDNELTHLRTNRSSNRAIVNIPISMPSSDTVRERERETE